MNGAPEAGARPAAAGIYLRSIRRHKGVIALLTIVTFAATLLWLNVREPTYAAEAQVLVTPLSPDDETFFGLQLLRDSGDDPTRVLTTAATIVRSPEAARSTAERMGAGWSAKRVLDSVEVSPVTQSSLLRVEATADDARTAARLANTFTDASLDVRAERLAAQVDATIDRLRARVESATPPGGAAPLDLSTRINQLESVREGQDPTLSVIESATVPGEPAGPGDPVVLALALVVGLALGIAAALLLELVNRRVRDEDEAVELYPLPVLARVPIVPRRSYQRKPGLQWNVPPQVYEAFRTVLVQLTPRGRGAKGRAMMVTSASTGDGKTTSAINLAVSIAAAGHRVILIDFDIRKPDIQRTLGVGDAQALTTLITNDLMNGGLKQLLTPMPGLPGLSVLATASPVSTNSVGLVEALHERLPMLLQSARELAEFIIIDSAPLGEVSDALRLADQVDDILIIARPGRTYRANWEMMRDLLQRTGHRPAGMVIIGETQGMSTGYYEYSMAVQAGESSSPRAEEAPPGVRVRS
jgi:Mrp family chromosome partitioning ATPase/capsular polysaccharide biosynthesis protein